MGIVYMLVFKNLHYIGSTIQKLYKRIKEHRSSYKRYLNKKSKNYCSSYEIIKNKNYELILIEEVERETREECNEREQLWIDFYGRENLVNNNNANGFNNEKFKKDCKQYYENNKQYFKDYYIMKKNKK